MRIAAVALLALPASGFYLPGVAPREYAEGERVEIKVNKLTSTKTQVRRAACLLCLPPLRAASPLALPLTPLSLRESMELAPEGSAERAKKRRRSLWRKGKNLALLEHDSKLAQSLREQRERTGKQALWTEDELDDIWDVLDPVGMRDKIADSKPAVYLAPAWRRLKEASPEIFAQRGPGPARCKVADGPSKPVLAASSEAAAVRDHGAGVGAVTSSTRTVASRAAALSEAAARAAEGEVGALSDTPSSDEEETGHGHRPTSARSVGASLAAALSLLRTIEESSAEARPPQPAAAVGAHPAGAATEAERHVTVTLTKGPAGFGLGLDAHNVVTELKPGTPARGLIRRGDRVLSLNGIRVS